MKSISSIHNPLVKSITKLQEKSRERRKSGLFVIEGFREISLALKAGYAINELLYCDKLVSHTQLEQLISLTRKEIKLTEITLSVYQKIAYRSSTEGFLAVAQSKANDLSQLQLPDNPLILIAEAPEKPGNIGALLRTADAAGADAFILANPLTDLYNPNLIRSSVGGVFTQNIALGNSEEIVRFLAERNIAVYAAILQQAVAYDQEDYTQPSAIVVGTEADGLTEVWRKAARQNIIIPMQGDLDSMNVSVAAGILIFEARRQRGFR